MCYGTKVQIPFSYYTIWGCSECGCGCDDRSCVWSVRRRKIAFTVHCEYITPYRYCYC